MGGREGEDGVPGRAGKPGADGLPGVEGPPGIPVSELLNLSVMTCWISSLSF